MTSTSRILVLGLMLLTVGCATLSRPDPDRRHYMLQVERPQILQAESKPGEGVLAVRAFRVASAYDAKGIVTIRSGGRVESDFYNQFFLLPGEMISSQVRQWLRASGMFALVSNLGGLKAPDMILEGIVQELYRDYRTGSPQAVLAMQILLLRSDQFGAMDVVLQENYRQVRDLPDDSIQSLVGAWNDALEHVLMDLEDRLREVMPASLDNPL
ncbi:cholesterol transport system auxiliary component [Desulfonatronum thiosulfatophilum]|uniref:Cholesterol transport system auxiliary component n=1 Tax=Desulfonatronum thiosulfatophilum TaxID=617002 RepID=A0A1G6A026_9BACT|nr:ABC-type transport auxiliary lipoprotein family protein [Desulfonatronum thiosulfatophilum]SDB01791.1 cholesterol transport system auxiliary component [Desulfonatronum thiosulfatophilum]